MQKNHVTFSEKKERKNNPKMEAGKRKKVQYRKGTGAKKKQEANRFYVTRDDRQ